MRGYGIVRVLTDRLSRWRRRCGKHNAIVIAPYQALTLMKSQIQLLLTPPDALPPKFMPAASFGPCVTCIPSPTKGCVVDNAMISIVASGRLPEMSRTPNLYIILPLHGMENRPCKSCLNIFSPRPTNLFQQPVSLTIDHAVLCAPSLREPGL
jgi:hypothetical protein